VSAAIVERLVATDTGAEVVYRDLAAAPVAHLTGADLAAANAVLDEFLVADVVVIGVPMYNFAIPSQLKAWVDRILIAGKTFRYTEKGPQGLAGGKRVILAFSRGGMYGAGMPNAAAEHQESYLRTVFGFIGIADVEAVHAEGIAFGPEQRAKSLEAALQAAAALAPLAYA
jgi:FMN-dependent NADH-azoreductase